MAYVADPRNPTQPSESVDLVTAAAEFRALKAYVRDDLLGEVIDSQEAAEIAATTTAALLVGAENRFDGLDANIAQLQAQDLALAAQDDLQRGRLTTLEGGFLYLNWRGDWATATAYEFTPAVRRDYFIGPDGTAYVVLQSHTSTSIAADLAAGKIGDIDSIQLRADLGGTGAGQGITMVGNAELPLATYADLRAYTGAQTRVYITGPLGSAKPAGIAGSFQHDPEDTTSADNGGTIIVGADGRRWKRDFSGAVLPEWFGAVGDGVTDDLAALIAAGNVARTTTRKVQFAGKRYFVSDTFPVYSRVEYVGVSKLTEIYSVTENKPVIASASYLSALSFAPTGHCTIKNIRALSSGSVVGVKGIVLRDYYSHLDHVETGNTSGGGIELTHVRDDGVSVSGTLVENRITSPRVYQHGGIGINLGALDNNKLTDGYLTDAIVWSGGEAVRGIFCGSAAGWVIDGFHHYGGVTSSSPVLISNSFNTRVTGYLEYTSAGRGIVFSRTQQNLYANITAKLPTAVSGDEVVRIEKASFVTSANVQLVLRVDHNAVDVPVTALANTTGVDVQAQISVRGQYSNRVTEIGGTAAQVARVARATRVAVDGTITETSNRSALIYEGRALPWAFSSNFSPSNPAVEIVRNFSIVLRSYQSVQGTIHINSRSNYNATRRLIYVAALYIQSKLNGSDNWVVSADSMVAASGFSAAPAFSVTSNGDGTGTLTVTFTPSSTDGFGGVKLLLAPNEVSA